MTIVIEDGSGLPNAEAYISVADADAYFLARGNTAWASLSEERKEQVLRDGADYMTAVYGSRWKGVRKTAEQALDWPRTGVVVNGFAVADNIVPEPVRRANAELAVRASAGPLLVDLGAQVKQETVGPITVVYQDGARQSTRYAAVDGLLGAYLRDGGGGGQIPVVRA
ncbi:DnaT-like ssDNA-binding protein [Lysobacter enzymogenes]|uniref:DnaT-like ssDNA-binding protein n=1 Tax=Lysobacter enzymogenes TaxID=69 RepID=UPI001A96609A|nr:DnaT-like ssDNA-binding protein [Lysobacter enzymogenes]QQP96544.1 hypothetical protein JHW38_00350 [Lysobacter enzymogenes]